MSTERPAGPDYSCAVSKGAGGSLVNVWAVPGASSTEITGLHGTAVRIRVAAPPEGGQANRALEKVLADLTETEVVLVRGPGSRRKQFLVKAVSPAVLAGLIAGQTG